MIVKSMWNKQIYIVVADAEQHSIVCIKETEFSRS